MLWAKMSVALHHYFIGNYYICAYNSIKFEFAKNQVSDLLQGASTKIYDHQFNDDCELLLFPSNYV